MQESRITAGKLLSISRKPLHRSVAMPVLTRMQKLTSDAWVRRTKEVLRERFQYAYEQVPAYREFLKQQGVETKQVRATKDLNNIPAISKKNYLRVNEWNTLCAEGVLSNKPLVLTATSGSTGEPFYIPRTDEVHDASMMYHRLFVDRSGLQPKKSTLVMVCFGMGVWIGGLITYEAFRGVSKSGVPLTLITPGVNKKEIFEALARVGPSYEQLVLCGYPPFIKDLLDDGVTQGIDWTRWDTRIVCAAEAFSEYFREHLMKVAGITDPYRGIMNIYGSAELGTMATETPVSILLRRLALKNESLYSALFREAHRLPTLAQFIPDATAFEEGPEGKIYATSGTTLPFVRYDIGDNGGVFTYADAVRMCEDSGIDLAAEIDKAGIGDAVMELPFVYVYERADLSTKLYGAIIYPEHVKVGLQHSDFEEVLTGRFTLVTEHDADHNEYLQLNVELQQGSEPTDELKRHVTEAVVDALVRNSDEYRYLYGSIRTKVTPRVVFWPHEDPQYFQPGIKQKWVIR